MSKALTFYVSFDNGSDADFGKGNKKIYTGDFKGGPDQTGIVSKPGLGKPPLFLAKGKGKHGTALGFTEVNSHVVFYNLEKNIEFDENNFVGTVSFWINTDANEIPGQYCDPIQITDKYYASDAIWVDITKNDIPPDLRLGVYGDQKVWDVKNRAGAGEEFFWRILKVSEPPLKKNIWTHVAVTWQGINTGDIGRGKLYLNGEYRGQTGPIREPFKWDISKVTMRLGTGKFVGLLDEIALFNKALTLKEIKILYNLKNGIRELNP